MREERGDEEAKRRGRMVKRRKHKRESKQLEQQLRCKEADLNTSKRREDANRRRKQRSRRKHKKKRRRRREQEEIDEDGYGD